MANSCQLPHRKKPPFGGFFSVAMHPEKLPVAASIGKEQDYFKEIYLCINFYPNIQIKPIKGK